jgi:hypothetical protein
LGVETLEGVGHLEAAKSSADNDNTGFAEISNTRLRGN